MRTLSRLMILVVPAGMILASCEGPMGKDANETCKECHNSTVVDAKKIEYEHSLHGTGTAFEEGSRAGCAPCHSSQGFRYVAENNIPATFTADPANAGKFINNYQTDAKTASLPGPIDCFTCHDKIHTTYEYEDIQQFTNTAEVPMTMWGGTKTINFAKNTGNLCAKCHQPRPVTASSGNMINYAALVSTPAATFNMASISYRTGVHYGTQGAMAAGVGAVEFGSGYTNSAHATNASCASCHMAEPSGISGGHSFIADQNFTGCNSCHQGMSATNTTYTGTVAQFNTLLAQLATKINAIGAGHDILQKDPTDNQYHGYIDIYDASANPTGYWKNPANGTPAFPALTNAQFGAIINFQLLARDGSHGIHNFPYMKKLLENTIAAI
jgi:hypothetical protein